MTLVAGIDEVGRGALAGPLYAVVLVFRAELHSPCPIPGVRDSKKTESLEREKLFPQILGCPLLVDVGVGWGEVEEIETIGIDPANNLAFLRALEALKPSCWPDPLIVDGNKRVKGTNVHQLVVAQADAKHWQVGAASIIAKVLRDRLMIELATKHSQYDWQNNSGYGSKKHREAILQTGTTVHHRMSFLRKILGTG